MRVFGHLIRVYLVTYILIYNPYKNIYPCIWLPNPVDSAGLMDNLGKTIKPFSPS